MADKEKERRMKAFYAQQQKQAKRDEKIKQKMEKQEERDRKKRGYVGSHVSGPTDFAHESHVGWSTDAGFEIRNIPPAWKLLFEQAGATEADLQDPETRRALVATMKSATGEAPAPEFVDKSGNVVAPPAAPPPPSAPKAPSAGAAPAATKAAPTKAKSPRAAGDKAPKAPPAAAAAPRAPVRADSSSALADPLAPGAKVKAKWAEDGQFYDAEVVRPLGGDSFCVRFTEYGNEATVAKSDIQPAMPSRATKPVSVYREAPEPPSDDGGGGGLADQLKNARLKSASAREIPDTPPPSSGAAAENDIVNSLARTLAARREGMMLSVYQPAGGGDDDDAWNDDDDDWADNF